MDSDGSPEPLEPTPKPTTQPTLKPAEPSELTPKATEPSHKSTKPSESIPTKPSEPTPTKPSESIPTKPSEPTPTEPSESIPTEPSESIPTKPSEPTPTEPSESIPTEPSESIPTEPSEPTPKPSVPTEPSEPTAKPIESSEYTTKPIDSTIKPTEPNLKLTETSQSSTKRSELSELLSKSSTPPTKPSESPTPPPKPSESPTPPPEPSESPQNFLPSVSHPVGDKPAESPPPVFDGPEVVRVKIQGHVTQCGAEEGLGGLLWKQPQLVADLAELLAPRVDQVVVRVHVASFTWHVLTKDQEAREALERSCQSNDFFQNLIKLFEKDAEFDLIKMKSSYVTIRKDFDDIRREAIAEMKRMVAEGLEEAKEIVFYALDDVEGAETLIQNVDEVATPTTPTSAKSWSTSSQRSVEYHYHQKTKTKVVNIMDSEGIHIGKITTATDGKLEEKGEAGSESDVLKIAIQKVKEAQKDYATNAIALQGIKISQESVPTVHPRMVEIDFYNENATGTDIYIPTGSQFQDYLKYGKRVSYEKLLKCVEKYNYICLCGYPGSGKTTLSKRLRKSLKQYVCFRLNFADINYPEDYKILLRELLLDKAYPKLDPKTCKDAFKWIKENDDQCVIIMDGYDRAKWSMSSIPALESYDVRQPIQEIIANLCKKHFLPCARIILTSRPHCLITIPNKLRPKYSLLLQDLRTNDMKSLLFAFAESAADRTWETLDKTAPCLKSFCLNPLMLQLYVRASRRSLEESGEMLTMTRIFSAVLSDMRESVSSRGRDIEAISDQLGKLAFKATSECRVGISEDDLKQEGLEVDNVQDLMTAFHDNSSSSNKDTKLYFSHQTLQEYFAARYVMVQMPFAEFQEFLKDYLFTDRWCMVRRYFCGLLVDINNDEFLQSSLLKMIFKAILGAASKENVTSQKKTALLEEMKSLLAHKKPDQRDLVFICNDIRECNSDVVTNAAAECFPRNIYLFNTPLAASDAHAVSFVLKAIKGKIERLILWNCNLQSSSFVYFCDAIKEMPGTIEMLDIRYNNLSTEDVVRLTEILDKIKNQLWMNEGLVYETGINRNANEEERMILQKALNGLENSTLQILVELTAEKKIYIEKQT